MPWPSPAISRLMASFLARRTMFSIIAPEEKSLKYRVSLSPFWYVTSKKRFSSSARYISATVFSIMADDGLVGIATAELGNVACVDGQGVDQVAGKDLLGAPARLGARS